MFATFFTAQTANSRFWSDMKTKWAYIMFKSISEIDLNMYSTVNWNKLKFVTSYVYVIDD